MIYSLQLVMLSTSNDGKTGDALESVDCKLQQKWVTKKRKGESKSPGLGCPLLRAQAIVFATAYDC
jgi:hypothetical protein